MSHKRGCDQLEVDAFESKRRSNKLKSTPSTDQDEASQLHDMMECDLMNEQVLKEAEKSAMDTGEMDDDEDDYEADPEMILPYLIRFQDSYQHSLGNYTSRLEKLALSEALRCTNDLFVVAIDHYQKQHQAFRHQTQVDLSGVLNIRREFEFLLTTKITCSQDNVRCSNVSKDDEKLLKVVSVIADIEKKICVDMKQIYNSYEKLLQELVMIEYRLGVIIEMFHHMTDVEPQNFLPSLPFIQNVPDLIGYVNSLYDEDNDLSLKDESTNERMQLIVNQFRVMHKRIRDSMDALHALSCIIMEKKTEVIDRVHTFYKKAEHILFRQPSYLHKPKDAISRSL